MLPRYDPPDSAWFEYGAERVTGEFINGLRPIWPDIDENLVRAYVNRERMVQAIWIDQPPDLRGPARNPQGTVWSVNAELTGRDTLNNNAIVKVADQAAAEILRSLQDSAGGMLIAGGSVARALLPHERSVTAGWRRKVDP